MEGHIADEVVADALRVLHAELAGVKFLGSYPAEGTDGAVVREKVGVAWRDAEALDGGSPLPDRRRHRLSGN